MQLIFALVAFGVLVLAIMVIFLFGAWLLQRWFAFCGLIIESLQFLGQFMDTTRGKIVVAIALLIWVIFWR